MHWMVLPKNQSREAVTELHRLGIKVAMITGDSNIRSVDGLVFNDGSHPLHSGESFGGYIMNGPSPVDCQR